MLHCSGMQSSAGMTLLAGGNVPTYHPSLVPRGRAGSPHAPDMGLHPTSPEALDDLLRQLKTDRHTLEVCLETGVQMMHVSAWILTSSCLLSSGVICL